MNDGEKKEKMEIHNDEIPEEKPEILEEIEVEDLMIDGICGVY